MDMIFGYPLRESFGRGGGRGVSLGSGRALDYIPAIRANRLNGNINNSSEKFLGATTSYYEGDDQPLFFGFRFL